MKFHISRLNMFLIINSTYCCSVSWTTLIVRIRRMPEPQTGVTHYHAQLGPSDKNHAIKGLVVCYVVWLWSMIYWIGLWTSARCVGLVPWNGQEGCQAQHPIDTCRYIHWFTMLIIILKGSDNSCFVFYYISDSCLNSPNNGLHPIQEIMLCQKAPLILLSG